VKDLLTNAKLPAIRRSFMKLGLAVGGAAMGSRLFAGSVPTLAGAPLSPNASFL
jgi:hypothetical protein